MFAVSVILPVYNAEGFLSRCLKSVYSQSYRLPFELSIFNDGSSDSSSQIIYNWMTKLESRNISLKLNCGETSTPKGVGYAKNRAIANSSGEYLCFLDADDEMNENRIEKQLQACKALPRNTLVGCKFHREPANSTSRYTMWANSITQDQLYTQRYLSHGPTLIMPTWFCHRSLVDSIGGFDESGKGTPEDLIFFNKHLDSGGLLHRVDEDLLMYRYHADATTFSVTEETIWNLRVEVLQRNVLSKWSNFSIWNAGKQGRKLFRSLSEENKQKVTSFCDVDVKKINKGFYTYEESTRVPKPRVPIVHFSKVQKPVIICVKLDLPASSEFFKETFDSFGFTEGVDYFHFN